MKLRILFLVLAMTLAASFARADVLVFSAASLKEPLDQIAARFDGVVVSYGGSGTLARQVSLGAPADVILLANVDWMDYLAAQGAIDPNSLAGFASNRLILVAGQGHEKVTLDQVGLADALGQGRLAVGLTNAVPAGIYAKAALQSLGLWDGVQGRLAEVDNVRAALALVARGQAPMGIVYRTDVRVSPDVVEVAEFPAQSHPPIRYVGAVVENASVEARAFWDYVRGPQGQAIFAQAGFLPALEPAQ
ncbi:MAG: molybdate transport system substrate-binding protein [Yoonia sp.]|jgi:molybdate transport system substrate-binding protein